MGRMEVFVEDRRCAGCPHGSHGFHGSQESHNTESLDHRSEEAESRADYPSETERPNGAMGPLRLRGGRPRPHVVAGTDDARSGPCLTECATGDSADNRGPAQQSYQRRRQRRRRDRGASAGAGRAQP